MVPSQTTKVGRIDERSNTGVEPEANSIVTGKKAGKEMGQGQIANRRTRDPTGRATGLQRRSRRESYHYILPFFVAKRLTNGTRN